MTGRKTAAVGVNLARPSPPNPPAPEGIRRSARVAATTASVAAALSRSASVRSRPEAASLAAAVMGVPSTKMPGATALSRSASVRSRPAAASLAAAVMGVPSIRTPSGAAALSRSASVRARPATATAATAALQLRNGGRTGGVVASGTKVVNKNAEVNVVTNALAAVQINGTRQKAQAPVASASTSHGGAMVNAGAVPKASTSKPPTAIPATLFSQNPHVRKSLVMASTALLSNFDATLCAFCTLDLKPSEGVMLQDCLHVFCRDCLQAAIEGQQDSLRIPCPVSCGSFISDREVKQLVSPQVYQEYLDRSLTIAKKKMKNVFNCTTDGCTSWCEFEEGRKTFTCPSCGAVNCMLCSAIHPGLDCATFATLTPAQVRDLLEKEKKTGLNQVSSIIATLGGGDAAILEETDLLRNTLDFECAICFADVAPGEGVILHECLHLFCGECLVNLVEHNDEATVKCPYIDGNYSCVWNLQPREIKALVPPAVLEKHLQRSVKLGESNDPNSVHCKTPDCRGWVINDENHERFQCPICKKMNCIKCNVIHDGTCEDYQNRIKQNVNDKLSEEAIEDLIKKGEYMRCPKCKIPVQKAVGCDWIMCPCCRLEICWITRGPRWGPMGKGDISGGCRCRVKGKKCHPKCGNCH